MREPNTPKLQGVEAEARSVMVYFVDLHRE